MADETDFSALIEEAATGPASVSADGTTVNARPISDLIEADKHLANKRAAKKKSLGIRRIQIVQPGTQ